MVRLHLFFDVFIEDAPLGIYLRGDPLRFEEDFKIRTASKAYRYQSKFDITRYSLISYSDFPWTSSTLRVACQNPQHESIYKEIQDFFPNGSLHKNRSSTAKEYFEALSSLGLDDDEWIFFCPNNDHPFISNYRYLELVLKDADEAVKKLDPQFITIPYSHYTEHVNFIKHTHHERGVYGNIFPKLLYETEHSYVVKMNKMLIDSMHISRLGDLKWIFGNSKKSGRVIRQEDTEFYLSNAKEHIMIIPKYEFCRHYDGYLHIAEKVPPLFIPDGFFESSIKIKYGYEQLDSNFVNINPLKDKFSYQSSEGTDLKILLEDIPRFWGNRIGLLDSNPEFPNDLAKSSLPYYLDLENPWRKSNKFINYLRSHYRYARYLWRRMKGVVN
jgi:hypothetical protein